MKSFQFKLYIRTAQKQEFLVNMFTIQAKNYDMAKGLFNKRELPYHDFSTVQLINTTNNN